MAVLLRHFGKNSLVASVSLSTGSAPSNSGCPIVSHRSLKHVSSRVDSLIIAHCLDKADPNKCPGGIEGNYHVRPFPLLRLPVIRLVCFQSLAPRGHRCVGSSILLHSVSRMAVLRCDVLSTAAGYPIPSESSACMPSPNALCLSLFSRVLLADGVRVHGPYRALRLLHVSPAHSICLLCCS